MPNPQGSRNVYLPRDVAEKLAHLSNEDISVLLIEGRDLFASLEITPGAEKIIKSSKRLAEAVDKW